MRWHQRVTRRFSFSDHVGDAEYGDDCECDCCSKSNGGHRQLARTEVRHDRIAYGNDAWISDKGSRVPLNTWSSNSQRMPPVVYVCMSRRRGCTATRGRARPRGVVHFNIWRSFNPAEDEIVLLFAIDFNKDIRTFDGIQLSSLVFHPPAAWGMLSVEPKWSAARLLSLGGLYE